MSSKLELAILAGPESKAFLNTLLEVVERLEAVAVKLNGAKKDSGQIYEEADPTPKAKVKTKAVEEEQFDLGSDEEPEEKHTISIRDVIAACKANRETAVKVLKKLKVKSVHELSPTQYSKVMSEIGA